jgi:hypothetical protein
MAPNKGNQIKDTKVEYENCCYSDQLLLLMQSATSDELLVAMFYLLQEYRDEIKQLKKRMRDVEEFNQDDNLIDYRNPYMRQAMKRRMPGKPSEILL